MYWTKFLTPWSIQWPFKYLASFHKLLQIPEQFGNCVLLKDKAKWLSFALHLRRASTYGVWRSEDALRSWLGDLLLFLFLSGERHNTKELEKWRRALTHASHARNNPGTAQGGAGGMREISSVLMAIKFYSTASSSICARLNEGILPSNATEDPWCYKLITFDWTL